MHLTILFLAFYLSKFLKEFLFRQPYKYFIIIFTVPFLSYADEKGAMVVAFVQSWQY